MAADLAAIRHACAPVPLDSELEPRVLEYVGRHAPITMESIAARRSVPAHRPDTASILAGVEGITYEDAPIPGPPGAPALETTILRPLRRGPGPVLLFWHGGGFINGTRTRDTASLACLAQLGVTVVNADYRLAPEHPCPAAQEDAYAALAWVTAAAGELGSDGRIVVAGRSAGGGLAAAAALMARDRCGPPVAGALLLAPMLDDRMQTASIRQVSPATWTADDNRTAWRCVLGVRAGGAGVSPYAAPARVSDLSGFPPAYLEVGDADIFRDEVICFALRGWEHGVPVNLSVVAGAPHGYDTLAPSSRLARQARRNRVRWLRSLLRI